MRVTIKIQCCEFAGLYDLQEDTNGYSMLVCYRACSPSPFGSETKLWMLPQPLDATTARGSVSIYKQRPVRGFHTPTWVHMRGCAVLAVSGSTQITAVRNAAQLYVHSPRGALVQALGTNEATYSNLFPSAWQWELGASSRGIKQQLMCFLESEKTGLDPDD